jgi:hypothetical protein
MRGQRYGRASNKLERQFPYLRRQAEAYTLPVDKWSKIG